MASNKSSDPDKSSNPVDKNFLLSFFSSLFNKSNRDNSDSSNNTHTNTLSPPQGPTGEHVALGGILATFLSIQSFLDLLRSRETRRATETHNRMQHEHRMLHLTLAAKNASHARLVFVLAAVVVVLAFILAGDVRLAAILAACFVAFGALLASVTPISMAGGGGLVYGEGKEDVGKRKTHTH